MDILNIQHESCHVYLIVLMAILEIYLVEDLFALRFVLVPDWFDDFKRTSCSMCSNL